MRPSFDPAPAQGRIGSYEIRAFLGRGATATVYECRHVALGRRAAIKILHPHLARDAIAAARFLREGRAISRISHPNVVEVFDVGEENGIPFLVMSIVDGISLADYLRRTAPMSMTDVADCMVPVVCAVAAAHDVNVLHRDLKPSNIRMTRDRDGVLHPIVLDFGISKFTDAQTGDLTDSFGVLGTAGYSAPEQLRCPRDVDATCDVYALGVVLYECATLVRPFRGASPYDLMHAVLTAPVLPPSSLRPDLPAAFDAIVLRAMQRDPLDRFPSVRDLGLALSSLASHPARWTAELASPANLERPVADRGVPRPNERPSRPSWSPEHSFTLQSQSPPRRAHGRWMVSVVAVAGLGCAAWAGALPRTPQSSPKLGNASPQRPGETTITMPTAAPPGPVLTTQANAAPPKEAPVAPPRAEGPAPAARAGTATVRVTTGPRQEAPSPPPISLASAPSATLATPPREEMGANGAPILE